MEIKKNSILKNQSGAALVIALIMMIVLTLIGLASIFTSTFEMKISGNKRGSTNAFYRGESGIQVVTANIQNFATRLPIVSPYNPFTDATTLILTLPTPQRTLPIILPCSGHQGEWVSVPPISSFNIFWLHLRAAIKPI